MLLRSATLLADTLKQFPAGRLDEVQNERKAVCRPEIWIRYRVTCKFRCIVKKQLDTRLGFVRLTPTKDIEIVAVHGKDVVKLEKIRHRDLTAHDFRKIEATLNSSLLCAAVWRLPNVIRMGARGIDV